MKNNQKKLFGEQAVHVKYYREKAYRPKEFWKKTACGKRLKENDPTRTEQGLPVVEYESEQFIEAARNYEICQRCVSYRQQSKWAVKPMPMCEEKMIDLLHDRYNARNGHFALGRVRIDTQWGKVDNGRWGQMEEAGWVADPTLSEPEKKRRLDSYRASRFACTPQIDFWVMVKSWTDYNVLAFEIKMSRGDWLQDRKFPEYWDACNKFYLATPQGLLKPEEIERLPAQVGLVEAFKNEKGIRPIKESYRMNVDIDARVFRAILMNRAKPIIRHLS